MAPARTTGRAALALIAGLLPLPAAAQAGPDRPDADLSPAAQVLPAAPAAPSDDADMRPLSAIDWLSRSVREPVAGGDETPVADSATTPPVTVTPLDDPSPDRVGLLPPAVTGLPRTLWSASEEAVLVALLQAERVETLPAIQDLIVTLMIAEAEPPLGAGPEAALFVARVDKLLDLGALDPAQAMLDAAGPETPALFRRWFDVALLNGTEDTACDLMRERPDIAPTFPARIFCLARGGDWMAAALTLNTARVLGDVTEEEDALLARFLDPELFEGLGPIDPPTRISPLVFRMREAIGEALPTSNLPRAFAHADLRFTTGWKSQVEAAERLARHGAISENAFMGFYTARTRAASGGVWDRVDAMQKFDAAMQSRAADAVAATLPAAWAAMTQVRTEVPFARFYGPALTELARNAPDLPPEIAALAYRIALLSDDYETAARAHAPGDPAAAFLTAIARGEVTDAAPQDPAAAAVHAAFSGAPLPAPAAGLIAEGKLGEALLRAIADFNEGLAGDRAALTDAFAVLRATGLEDVARRAALQYLLLERRS